MTYSTKLTLTIVTVILIAGGGIYGFLAKTSVKDVAYYNDHPDIRKEVIAQCDNNAVLDKEDGNCLNAKRS